MSTNDLKFPGYRIVAHYGGTTYGWPVSADRIADALADRIGKVDPEITLENAELTATELLKRVDENGGQEVEIDGDSGRLWISALDPRNDQQRDTLHAIGVVSYAFPA
jgi:hypothetical protein